jgi:hypothetical protein
MNRPTGPLYVHYEERPNNRAFCKLCQMKIHAGAPTIVLTAYKMSPAYLHKSCVEKAGVAELNGERIDPLD